MKRIISLALLLIIFAAVHAQTSQTSGKTTSKSKTSSKTTTSKTPATTTTSTVKTPAKIDAKTKEFIIPSDTKAEFRFYGFQFPNESTKKMICFSSDRYDVASNIANCPLGSYYNTGGLNLGTRIVYLGKVGNYGKMNFIDGAGKKTLIYIPNSSFTIK